MHCNPDDLCAYVIALALLVAAGVYTAEYFIEKHKCFAILAFVHVILALAELVRHALAH